MFSSAGNIDGTGSRQAADQSPNGGAGVSGSADVGILEHGVPKSAHAAVERGFRLGEDIDQLTARRRLGGVTTRSPTLFNASITAAELMASRMTACPISNGLAEYVELPRTITTLCISSMPADVDATDENRSKFRSTCSSAARAVDLAQRHCDPERRCAARICHRAVCAVCNRSCCRETDAASMRSLVRSGHLICTKCTSCGSTMAASAMAATTAFAVSSICALRPSSSGRKSRVCAIPMLRRLPEMPSD